MKLKLVNLVAGVALAVGVASMTVQPVLASGFFTNGVPTAGGSQYPTTFPLTGNEQIPADTELSNGQNPQSEAITTSQLATLSLLLPSRGNALIGGDATTNLWQRATTGASETTTYAYGGPDRWAYWSGTSTAMTVSRDSTAGDLPTGYQYAFKMARTSGQTGVVQVCMAQEVESANSYQFAGSTAELDFHAYTGANYSAASQNMTAYIIYGTGSDEGMQKLAYGLNAGGGGSTGWTGQANATAAVINLGAVSTAGRYAAVATIPATATEVGVALCFTPVGTAGTNDYLAFDGIQLIRSGLGAAVSTTAGYVCNPNSGGPSSNTTSNTAVSCASFERRLAQVEALYQYRYYWKLSELTTKSPVSGANCKNASTTEAECVVQFPTLMRAAPVFTGDGSSTAGFAVETTTAGGTLGNCTQFLVPTTVEATIVASLSGVVIGCGAATVPAAGGSNILFSNNGSGVIGASSEL